MDDMRQFGDCLRYEPSLRDLSEFCSVGVGARIADIGQGFQVREDLARVVQAEIIPRLMLAHRPEPETRTGNILPDAEQIAAFATLMLAPAGDDLESRLAELLASGLAHDSLLLDLLAPTARHLGTLWEEDLCDFVEVTRAMGRLQRIMHEVTHHFGCEPEEHRDGRAILLLPCPGDSHSFGLAMVERFFHEAGWAVTRMESERVDALCACVRNDWFDVVGLSLACEVLLPRMTEIVADIRRHSRNPTIRVMVGGPVFIANSDGVAQVGADATANDARHALYVAESLLDLPIRPC